MLYLRLQFFFECEILYLLYFCKIEIFSLCFSFKLQCWSVSGTIICFRAQWAMAVCLTILWREGTSQDWRKLKLWRMSNVAVVLRRAEGWGGWFGFMIQIKLTKHLLRLSKANRRKFFKEVLNPRFLELKKQGQTRDRVSCIFRLEKTENELNFASHDIDMCRANDFKNGNILEHEEGSRHGSVSTLNMEWDSQGI